MSRRPILLLAVLTLALSIGPAEGSIAATRYRTLSTVTVAPGLTYKAILDTRGPNHIYEMIVAVERPERAHDLA